MALEEKITLPAFPDGTQTLEAALRIIDPSTVLQAHEIIAERGHPEVGDRLFIVSDLLMYKAEEGEAVLYLAPGKSTPLLRNPERLSVPEGFHAPREEFLSLLHFSGGSLRLPLSRLDLTPYTDVEAVRTGTPELAYLELPMDQHLRGERRVLFSHIYAGQRNPEDVQAQLFLSGVQKVRVYLLNPDYVLKHAEQGTALLRLGTLSGYRGTGFNAASKAEPHPLLYLRGRPHQDAA